MTLPIFILGTGDRAGQRGGRPGLPHQHPRRKHDQARPPEPRAAHDQGHPAEGHREEYPQRYYTDFRLSLC